MGERQCIVTEESSSPQHEIAIIIESVHSLRRDDIDISISLNK